ncbi:MAG TPA: GAF domain-containing protein [Gammaproteobacteria bacterium]|nr:GAF domain-containing protein [Gammaproteobacteria bacterium]
MRMGIGLRALLSLLILIAFGVFACANFTPRGFPVNAQGTSDYVGTLHAIPGVPLPAGFQDGDRVDIREQSFETRIAIILQHLPLGYTTSFVIERGSARLTVQGSVVDLSEVHIPGQAAFGWFQWPQLAAISLLSGIALLLLWRGRDRAAFGMGLWAITYLCSVAATCVPLAGWPGLIVYYLGMPCFLAARVGFYIMIEAGLGKALAPRRRRAFRAVFIALLAAGAVQAIGSQLVRLITGSAEFLTPDYGLILSASYFVPIVMLFVGYGPAPVAERQRLRWMLVSGVTWAASIFLQNTPLLGGAVSNVMVQFLQILALLGFLYAVLKLRVVDIAVVIDRALVYGLVTTLVVGVIAAVNSLALRETVTPGASLALRVIVPLALGIVLGRVRTYADLLVEQVFFRSKHMAETALRQFALHAGYVEDASKLLDAATREIQRHIGTPAVAVYSAERSGYQRIQQAGAAAFPPRLDRDDPALVAARAEKTAVDLGPLTSTLGEDGCVFPILVLGKLRGAIVCRNRPGEHYAGYEKALLTDVSQAVGAAWSSLRAQDNEAYVHAMAAGELGLDAARDQARKLALAGTE